MYKVSIEHLEKIRDLLMRASIELENQSGFESYGLSIECNEMINLINNEYLNIQP